jgi:hypothetical protein
MPSYRIHVVGNSDIDRVPTTISCDTDQGAIQAAKNKMLGDRDFDVGKAPGSCSDSIQTIAIMSLVLKPNSAAEDNYHVMHGELQVGQLYKRKAAIRPEAQWLWALNGLPSRPDGHVLTGLAATIDDAMAALKESWSKWLASAELSESGDPQP